MRRALLAALALAVAVCALLASSASASSRMLVGIYDEPETLYGNPDFTYPLLKELRVQMIRLNLYWGGKVGVARFRPVDGADPADPAYDWSPYDRVVQNAAMNGIKVLFSVYGTPGWANGGLGLNHVPTNPAELEKFAYAAAKRYSGKFATADGTLLPPVRYWVAWNEPNNPVFLAPQYRKVRGKWVVQSAIDYTKICNAVYNGVHKTLISSEKVGCGVTAPRGNNDPSSVRPSTAPVAFLNAVAAAGLKRFDAWAHHPYYGNAKESPTTLPVGRNGAAPTAVTLANLKVLLDAISSKYGPRHVWITEYGYQTNPPDGIIGVSWASQAAYLTKAFAIARANPRVDLMLWFLLKDEPVLSGWQSGLLTTTNARKPAFAAFKRLAH